MKSLRKEHTAWLAVSALFPLTMMLLVVCLRPSQPSGVHRHPVPPVHVAAGSQLISPPRLHLMSPHLQMHIISHLANTFSKYL